MINRSITNWLYQLSISKNNLLLMNYRLLKISDQEIIIILQIQNMIDNNLIINPHKISEMIELEEEGVDLIIDQLVEKQLLTIRAKNNRIIFNFNKLYIKMLKLINDNEGTFPQVYYYVLIDQLETLLNRPLLDKEIIELNSKFKTRDAFKNINNILAKAHANNNLIKPFTIDWIYNLRNVEALRYQDNNNNLDYNWLEE